MGDRDSGPREPGFLFHSVAVEERTAVITMTLTSPAWRPADITESGREQLRAVGFTI